MICENCGTEFENSSKRFCNIKCARSFSSKASGLERNQKISEALRGKSKDSRPPPVHKHFCQFCGAGFVKRTSLSGHVPYCEMNPQAIVRESRKEKAREELLLLEYDALPPVLKREKLFREQSGKCNRCGLTDWQGFPITLELEHKNGNHYDNSRENVELLCPNCHSLTDTWRGRNKNKGKSGKRVSDEEFIEALRTTPSIRQALIKVGLAAKGGNYFRAKRLKEAI